MQKCFVCNIVKLFNLLFEGIGVHCAGYARYALLANYLSQLVSFDAMPKQMCTLKF